MSKKQINLSDSVMSQIDREHIQMKPRWYFVLGSFAMIMGIIGSAIISTFLVSFITFSIKTHGPMGEMRYQQLLSSFPWWAPIIAIIGLTIGVYLLNKYDFSYRKNFPLLIVSFIAVIVFSGWLIDYLGINTRWANHGLMRGLYQQYDGGWRGRNGVGNGKNLNSNKSASEGARIPIQDDQKELSVSIKTALDEAINDEYKALVTYEKVIQKFGEVRPFIMIKSAEEQHISSLMSLYETYKLTPPENRWSTTIVAPESVQKACQIGVEAELANARLYKEKLIPSVGEYPDIVTVFTNLMNASVQKHLPAFERCQ